MSNIGDTSQGILVGTEPAQPRQASEWTGQGQRPDQQVSQPYQVYQDPASPPQQQGPAPRWTDEDIERARQQEKDKLYGRLEELGSTVKTLQQEREQEQAERQRLADEAAEARRLAEEQEMGVKDLLIKRETEWQAQIQELSHRYDNDRAVFERERQLAEIERYRRDRIEQDAEFLLPELREFITGSTPEEVDQSIEAMKLRTEQIFANLTQAAPPPVPFQRGAAATTAPPVGPMEQLPTYETLTPEDIKGMDMETYKRYRGQLLQATNPSQRRQY